MSEKFKAYSAVFPIILKKDGDKTQILLHRRQNTGYMDGKWDFAGSGHVDKDETAKAAVVRECQEELGIRVRMEDAAFVHLSHRFSTKRTYYDIYFTVNQYEGTPGIMEPEKCSALEWFDLNALPPDMIECRKMAAQAYKDGIGYSEVREQL